MKNICTTVVRAAKQGDIHGGLYVVDVDTEEVVHHEPYQKDFINDNVVSISEAFRYSRDLQKIKTLVRELKFYEQLNKEANILMDEWL